MFNLPERINENDYFYKYIMSKRSPEMLRKLYSKRNYKPRLNEEIKNNLINCNFIYEYSYEHLVYLASENKYGYVLYLDKYIDEIPNIDISDLFDSNIKNKECIYDIHHNLSLTGKNININNIINKYNQINFENTEYDDIQKKNILWFNIYYNDIFNNHYNNDIINYTENIEYKKNLLTCNFIYEYNYNDLLYLIYNNEFSYVLYLNKYLNEIPDDDIYKILPVYKMKQLIIDVCKILNISNENIIKKFENLFHYNYEWYDNYEQIIYNDYFKNRIINNNLDNRNKSHFEQFEEENNYEHKFFRDDSFEKNIKNNLKNGKFIYLYTKLHLKYLSITNEYAYILYLNKYLNEIPDDDILDINSETFIHEKQFIIDVCNILNISNENIIKRFATIYDYENNYGQNEYEYRYQDYVLNSNMKKRNKKELID